MYNIYTEAQCSAGTNVAPYPRVRYFDTFYITEFIVGSYHFVSHSFAYYRLPRVQDRSDLTYTDIRWTMSLSKLYLYVARFAKYLKHKIFSRLNNMIIKNLFFYQFNFLLVICLSEVTLQGHCLSCKLCMILLAPGFFPTPI